MKKLRVVMMLCLTLSVLGIPGVFGIQQWFSGASATSAAAPFAEKGSPADGKPKPSKAAVVDGLSLTVSMAKTGFQEKEALAFTLQFKNVSKQARSLHVGPVPDWIVTFSQKGVEGWWEAKSKQPTKEGDLIHHNELLPGKTVDHGRKLDDRFVFQRMKLEGKKGQEMAKPVGAEQAHLPPGKYELTIDFVPQDVFFGDGKQRPKNWVKQIGSNLVEFEIAVAK